MIRIVGLGSPFGDDRVGWRVIELLRGRLPDHIDLVALDRPGAALVNWMQGVDWLLLIDAISCDCEPGRIIRIDPALPVAGLSAISSHGLDLAHSLKLAAALGSRPARIDLFGIAMNSLDGAELDPGVAAAAGRLARTLQEMMAAAPAPGRPADRSR